MKNTTEVISVEELKDITNAKYILFDMDGTLVNTEPLHAKALIDTLKQISPELEFSIEEVEKKYSGQSDIDVFKDIEENISISFDHFISIKNNFILTAIASAGPIVETKIIDFLKDLKKNNYLLALVTASEREVALSLLNKEGLIDYFDFVLAREDSTSSKPSPRPYLDALKKFNISADNAFAFEDSETGIESVRRSGIDYIAVDWFN